jgi:hypothetical protein
LFGEIAQFPTCSKNNLTDLPRFLDWLVEDFKVIENMKLDRMKTMEAVAAEGFLTVTVNIPLLLSPGDIVFMDNARILEDLCRRKNLNSDLPDIWRNRRERFFSKPSA